MSTALIPEYRFEPKPLETGLSTIGGAAIGMTIGTAIAPGPGTAVGLGLGTLVSFILSSIRNEKEKSLWGDALNFLQKEMTLIATSGKHEKPSDAFGLTGIAGTAVDLVLDPNWIAFWGIGHVAKIANAARMSRGLQEVGLNSGKLFEVSKSFAKQANSIGNAVKTGKTELVAEAAKHLGTRAGVKATKLTGMARVRYVQAQLMKASKRMEGVAKTVQGVEKGRFGTKWTTQTLGRLGKPTPLEKIPGLATVVETGKLAHKTKFQKLTLEQKRIQFAQKPKAPLAPVVEPLAPAVATVTKAPSWKQFWGTLHHAGKTKDEAHAFILERFGVKSAKKLTPQQMGEVMTWAKGVSVPSALPPIVRRAGGLTKTHQKAREDLIQEIWQRDWGNLEGKINMAGQRALGIEVGNVNQVPLGITKRILGQLRQPEIGKAYAQFQPARRVFGEAQAMPQQFTTAGNLTDEALEKFRPSAFTMKASKAVRDNAGVAMRAADEGNPGLLESASGQVKQFINSLQKNFEKVRVWANKKKMRDMKWLTELPEDQRALIVGMAQGKESKILRKGILKNDRKLHQAIQTVKSAYGKRVRDFIQFPEGPLGKQPYYLPRISKSGRVMATGPQGEVTGMATPWFAKARTAEEMADRITDPLELYDAYLRGAANWVHKKPLIEKWGKATALAPPVRAGLMQKYISFAGGGGRGDFSKVFDTWTKGISFLPRERGLEKGLRKIRLAVYGGTLGGNLGSPIKNLTQVLNVVPEVGARHILWAYRNLRDKKMWKELSSRNILQQPYRYLREGAGKKGAVDKMTNALMYFFDRSDRVNRFVTYHAAKRYFMSAKGRIKIDHLAKIEQKVIAGLMKKGQLARASGEYARFITANAQYLYDVSNAPLAFRGLAGKMFGQFGTWPTNFASQVGIWARSSERNQKLLKYALTSYGLAAAAKYGLDIDMKRWLPIEGGIIPSGLAPIPRGALGAAKYVSAALRKDKWSKSMAGYEVKQTFPLVIPAWIQSKRVVQFIQTLRQGGRTDRYGRVYEKGMFKALKRVFGLPPSASTQDFLRWLDEHPEMKRKLEKVA